MAAAGTAANSPHSRSIWSPYSRVALASSFAGSIRCGAPRSCTYTFTCGYWRDQRAGGPGVIEVDVGEQQPVQVARRDAESGQPADERSAGRWPGPGSTSSTPAGVSIDARRDPARAAEELQVDDRGPRRRVAHAGRAPVKAGALYPNAGTAP